LYAGENIIIFSVKINEKWESNFHLFKENIQNYLKVNNVKLNLSLNIIIMIILFFKKYDGFTKKIMFCERLYLTSLWKRSFPITF
jgi:hypothetical protein